MHLRSIILRQWKRNHFKAEREKNSDRSIEMFRTRHELMKCAGQAPDRLGLKKRTTKRKNHRRIPVRSECSVAEAKWNLSPATNVARAESDDEEDTVVIDDDEDEAPAYGTRQ